MTIRRLVMAACFLAGAFTFLVACYLLIGEIHFVNKSSAFNVSIVEVRKELVQKGKRFVMAYVPVVEIPSGTNQNVRMRVDTFSEEPTYQIGDKMGVLCDLSSSQKCARDTFISKWGDSLFDFIVAVALISVPVFDYWRCRRGDKTIRG
jgi:hypothetical protein